MPVGRMKMLIDMRHARTWMIGSVLLLTTLGATATAQDASPAVQISADGLLAVGKLAEQAEFGFGGNGALLVRPAPASSAELALLARLGYSHFPAEQDTDGDLSFITAGIGIKLDGIFSNYQGVFVVAEGGYAHTSIGARSADSPSNGAHPDITEHNPYASLGVGLETGKLVMQVRLVNVFGTYYKNYTWVPISIGVWF